MKAPEFRCPEEFPPEPSQSYFEVSIRFLSGAKRVETRWDRFLAEDLARFAAGSRSVEVVVFEEKVLR